MFLGAKRCSGTRESSARCDDSAEVSRLPLHVLALSLLLAGCTWPGKPDPAERPVPADKVMDFAALYQQNCSGCHGADGKMGPAPPLNDWLFLKIIPDSELLRVIQQGRRGTPMPAFSRSHGGSLTEAQVKVVAEGVKHHWDKSVAASNDKVPTYLTKGQGDAKRGEKVFARVCAMCHGDEGKGSESEGRNLRINDPAFLGLISDQALRRIVITGRPDLGMPSMVEPSKDDHSFQPLTSGEVDDVVALLSSWAPKPRGAARGQDRPAGPAKGSAKQGSK